MVWSFLLSEGKNEEQKQKGNHGESNEKENKPGKRN
jgi:hypothetical protein